MKYFIRKNVFTVIFFIFLFVFSGFYIFSNFETILADIKNASSWNEMSANVDASIGDKVPLKETFIELYGYQNVVLGKNENNGFDIVKDKDDVLYYSEREFTDDTDVLAGRIARLQEAVAGSGTQVLAFIMPDKYMEEIGNYYAGIPYRDGNDYLDKYAVSLEKYDIPYYDFRTTMINSGLKETDLFYKTDHHWTIDAAFLAYQDGVTFFRNTFGEDLDPNGIFTNPDNYNYEIYEDVMLGSMGRETGYLYSGIEDFAMMYPKFETSFRVDQVPMPEYGVPYTRIGGAEETLLDTDILSTTDIYMRDCYTALLGGIKHETHITNYNNPDGPKVLMLIDSYSSPYNIFFAQSCSQIDTYWIVELSQEENIEEIMVNGGYDYIIVSTYIESLAYGNFAFFEE